MNSSIRRALAALTFGADAQRHFDLAADRIARALLDVPLPVIAGLDIGIRAEPSRLIGGDYVDLFARGPGVLVFGLGDASGKSLAAALNAMMLRYLVRGLITAVGTDDLALIVKHTNTVVSHDVDADSFITFVCGELDTLAGSLRLVNAGHEPALILRHDAANVHISPAQGIVLGVDAEACYHEHETPVGPGDLILMYTDGLTEATNERGELYTIDRLCTDLVRNRTRAAQEVADAVFDTVRAYSDEGELRDDATVLVMRVAAEPSDAARNGTPQRAGASK